MSDQYLKTARTYLWILGLFLALAPIIGLVNYTFLRNSGEFEPVDKVVKLQLQNGGLYFSALNNTIHAYKLALYRAVKPKIVALGSSRVWQFRGRYFTVPFVNLGGAAQSLNEAELVLRKITAIHKPEIVLLNLDPWWFGNFGGSLIGNGQYPNGSEFRLDLLFLPCEWLLDRKISIRNFCQTLAGREQNPFPSMGVFAAVNREGFYQDGSLYNYGRVFGLFRKKGVPKFSSTEHQIRSGQEIFSYERTINPKRWADFVSLMKYAKAQNIRIITFLGPFPAKIVDLMASMGENYAYIDELKVTIPEVSPHNYDFLDPREFGSSDCEFLDGLHPGEITSLRMLRIMGRDPASGLSPYLDWPQIEMTISQYSGKAMVPVHSFGPQYKEIDFLELGCNKKCADKPGSLKTSRRPSS